MTNDYDDSNDGQDDITDKRFLLHQMLMGPLSPGFPKKVYQPEGNDLLATGLSEAQFDERHRPELPHGNYADSGVGEPLSGPDPESNSSEAFGESQLDGLDQAEDLISVPAAFDVPPLPPNSAKISLAPVFDFSSITAVRTSAKANALFDVVDLYDKAKQLRIEERDSVIVSMLELERNIDVKGAPSCYNRNECDFAEAVLTYQDAINCLWMWFCKEGHAEDMSQIMEEIQQHLETLVNGAQSVKVLAQSDFVLVPHDVMGYCRGLVLSPGSEFEPAEVLLVDYGAKRSVGWSRIFPIVPENRAICCPEPLARRCKMRELNYGFRPDNLDDFVSDFTHALTGPLRCFPVSDDPNFVDVILEYGSFHRDIGKKFDKLGAGLPRRSLPARSGRFAISRGTHKWKVSAVWNPMKFAVWPEFTRVVQYVNWMSHQMKEFYAAENDKEHGLYLGISIPEPDAMVGVLCDGKWLRGRVMSVEWTDHCLVYLSDFGEVGRFRFDVIRPLIEACMVYPALAVECVEVEIYHRSEDLEDDLTLNLAMQLIESSKQRECMVEVKQFVRMGDVVDNKWVKNDYAKVVLHLPDNNESYNGQLNKKLA